MRSLETIVKVLRLLAWSVVGLLVFVAALLATLFLANSPLPIAWLRLTLAAAFAIAVIACFVLLKPRWKAVIAFAGLFGLVIVGYAMIRPSNDRDWQPSSAQTASVEWDGDAFTIHNVRNFRYRTVDDFDTDWETRSYDLAKLNDVDLYMSYWGSTAIAHTMLAFGFEDGQYFCVSVEPRYEVGEGYSPVRSCFKAFELMYIVGDERDLIALRTNCRLEHGYLFPFQLSEQKEAELLRAVLRRVNELHENAEFYRTIADNCTTGLLRQFNEIGEGPSRCSIDLLFNGYLPRMAYEDGEIPTDAPLETVMERYAVSDKAQKGGDGPGFSQRIRENLGQAGFD